MCYDRVLWSHETAEETQSSSAEEFEAVFFSPNLLGHSAFPKQKRPKKLFTCPVYTYQLNLFHLVSYLHPKPESLCSAKQFS